MLKEQWSMAMKNHVRSCLKDVGKGWFNLHESNREVYEHSKLKKFLNMVNFMMQVCLTAHSQR